jgi:hypothetical protein
MNPNFIVSAAIMAVTMSLATASFAGANDYAFEPVNTEVKKGDGVTVAVHLVHKPTGKPVSDAVIFSPRIDMSPEGMESMTAPITPAAGAEPGSYAFKSDLVMAGRWLLSLSAKVQGEPDTVRGKVTFMATE